MKPSRPSCSGFGKGYVLSLRVVAPATNGASSGAGASTAVASVPPAPIGVGRDAAQHGLGSHAERNAGMPQYLVRAGGETSLSPLGSRTAHPLEPILTPIWRARRRARTRPVVTLLELLWLEATSFGPAPHRHASPNGTAWADGESRAVGLALVRAGLATRNGNAENLGMTIGVNRFSCAQRCRDGR